MKNLLALVSAALLSFSVHAAKFTEGDYYKVLDQPQSTTWRACGRLNTSLLGAEAGVARGTCVLRKGECGLYRAAEFIFNYILIHPNWPI